MIVGLRVLPVHCKKMKGCDFCLDSSITNDTPILIKRPTVQYQQAKKKNKNNHTTFFILNIQNRQQSTTINRQQQQSKTEHNNIDTIVGLSYNLITGV